MKKKLLGLLLISNIYSFSQIDSSRKSIMSLNFFQIGVNGEAGLSFDRIISKRYSLCVSIGYRFNEFFLTSSPGFIFPNLDYSPRKGILFSFGAKRFYGLEKDANAKRYNILLFHFKNNYCEGTWSYGHAIFGGTYRKSYYTEKLNLVGITFGTGFERYVKYKFVFDFSGSVGIYAGESHRTYLKDLRWNSQTNSNQLKDVSETRKKTVFFPFLQLRLNFGRAF